MSTRFLNDEERLSLLRRQKTERDRHSLDRIRSVLLRDKGWSSVDIAEALFIHQTTVDRYLREYQDSNKLSGAYKGREETLACEQSQELEEHIVGRVNLELIPFSFYSPLLSSYP